MYIVDASRTLKLDAELPLGMLYDILGNSRREFPLVRCTYI